jgi:hypothetical protein
MQLLHACTYTHCGAQAHAPPVHGTGVCATALLLAGLPEEEEEAPGGIVMSA